MAGYDLYELWVIGLSTPKVCRWQESSGSLRELWYRCNADRLHYIITGRDAGDPKRHVVYEWSPGRSN